VALTGRLQVTYGDVITFARMRGLTAMEEKDSDCFFGRERETIGALNALAMRQEKRPRIGRGQVMGTAAKRQRSSVGDSRALQLSEKVAKCEHHIGQNSNPECVHRDIWYLHEDANDRQHNEYE
jgi:hypothetical protein